ATNNNKPMHLPYSLTSGFHLLKLVVIGTLPLLSTQLHAFPPAPFHTLYGMVRDQNGQALRANGGEIIFYRDGTECLRMDMLRPGTQSYTGLANTGGTAFSLGVMLNSIVYYPIEMSQSRSIGRPGERVRLDLTLGIDSDGDGIPDAWEQSQLYIGGFLPDEDGWDLSIINRDDDFDNDGVSNWNEYIAGTFATDPTDYNTPHVSEVITSHVRLSFFGIYNKVYSLESSTDLKTWSSVDIYLSTPEAPPVDPEDYDPPIFIQPQAQAYLRSEVTDLIDIYAPADASGRTFYQLKVR
ncbi:MAG: hypothetical protein ACKVIY_15925, partial [Acidimicrobiales bacterium]